MSDKKTPVPTEPRIGASWWRQALASWRAPSVPGIALLGGAAALGGCYDAYDVPDDRQALAQMPEEIDQQVDALELQRQEGWNVGQPEARLLFRGGSTVDIDGTDRWRAAMPGLVSELAPGQPELWPYYVPTLFQSLTGPGGEQLAAQMQTVATPEMQESYVRGQAIGSLFHQVNWPQDTAVVVDLPGPDAVAVAAALSERFDPVFAFDNWPHPLGIVPSHETLGAALYYLPVFERTKASRPSPAAPVFVLDSQRLAPYQNQDTQFDNRYVARLPTVENLQQLGIRHVLYVLPDGDQVEADDLNDIFCAYQDAGIDVKLVAMSDIVRSQDPPPSGDDEALYVDWYVQWDGWWWYWGGDPWCHRWFWGWYGWHEPTRPIHIGHPPVAHLTRSFTYRAMPRPTMFSSLPNHAVAHAPPGVVSWRPPNIGRVAVRTSRVDGTLTGMRAGRVGSFSPQAASGVHSVGGHAGFGGHGGFGGHSVGSHSFGGSLGRVGGGFGGG